MDRAVVSELLHRQVQKPIYDENWKNYKLSSYLSEGGCSKIPGYIKPRWQQPCGNFSHSKKHLEQFFKGGQSFFHNLCINLYKLDDGPSVCPSIRLSDYSDSPFPLVLLVLLSFPNLVTVTFRDLILKIQLTGVLTFLFFPNKSLQKSYLLFDWIIFRWQFCPIWTMIFHSMRWFKRKRMKTIMEIKSLKK